MKDVTTNIMKIKFCLPKILGQVNIADNEDLNSYIDSRYGYYDKDKFTHKTVIISKREFKSINL